MEGENIKKTFAQMEANFAMFFFGKNTAFKEAFFRQPSKQINIMAFVIITAFFLLFLSLSLFQSHM